MSSMISSFTEVFKIVQSSYRYELGDFTTPLVIFEKRSGRPQDLETEDGFSLYEVPMIMNALSSDSVAALWPYAHPMNLSLVFP